MIGTVTGAALAILWAAWQAAAKDWWNPVTPWSKW